MGDSILGCLSGRSSRTLQACIEAPDDDSVAPESGSQGEGSGALGRHAYGI